MISREVCSINCKDWSGLLVSARIRESITFAGEEYF